MMSNITLQCLSQISSFLNTPAGKLTLDVNKVPVKTLNNRVTKGFIAIILELSEKHVSTSNLINTFDKAELYQWLEYAIVYGIHVEQSINNVNQFLKELNGILSTRTYLISSILTLADVVLYYILYNVMTNLSYIDKEKYINVSRWYDNLQQDLAIRQNNKVIQFSTNYLATVVPSKP